MSSNINTAVYDEDLPVITGIWDDTPVAKKMYGKYRVTVTFVGKVIGGVPQKPDVIESWLRQRIAGGDEEVRQMVLRTLEELGTDVSDGMTPEELDQLTKEVASKQHGNTFRRDSKGLFLSDYQVKAMVKESVAMLYPYSKENKMGPTGKAAKSFWSERVFVDEPRVHLMRNGEYITEPDGQHLQIGHVVTPMGPRNTLTYYSYVTQPTCVFTFSSLEDMIDEEMIQRVLINGQKQGLGAIRSMSFGQFKVVGFEKV